MLYNSVILGENPASGQEAYPKTGPNIPHYRRMPQAFSRLDANCSAGDFPIQDSSRCGTTHEPPPAHDILRAARFNLRQLCPGLAQPRSRCPTSTAPRAAWCWNLFAYFALALAVLALPSIAGDLLRGLAFDPYLFLHGAFWQPFTYSLVHPPGALMGTLFELLSLWFLAGFLENYHSSNWVTGLYVISVLGTAASRGRDLRLQRHAGLCAWRRFRSPAAWAASSDCWWPSARSTAMCSSCCFSLIGIKARYLVAIYALISIAMLFGSAADVRLCPVGRSAWRACL